MPDPVASQEGSESGVICIAGLGNPGTRYERTPHNAGFWVVDELARRTGIAVTREQSGTLTGTGQCAGKPVILVKPQTYMNRSGDGIGAVLRYRDLTNRNLVVVHDELDLPWTALRIKAQGSAAGHNGVKSIIAALKTDVFVRVRMGIRPERLTRSAADFVLAPLERELAVDVEEIVSYTADAIESIVAEGAAKAMARFNRRARGLQEEEE